MATAKTPTIIPASVIAITVSIRVNPGRLAFLFIGNIRDQGLYFDRRGETAGCDSDGYFFIAVIRFNRSIQRFRRNVGNYNGAIEIVKIAPKRSEGFRSDKVVTSTADFF